MNLLGKSNCNMWQKATGSVDKYKHIDIFVQNTLN